MKIVIKDNTYQHHEHDWTLKSRGIEVGDVFDMTWVNEDFGLYWIEVDDKEILLYIDEFEVLA